jgi:hypothetical protein
MWSVADNARVFLYSIYLYHEARATDVGTAVFDKDDALAVDFVTSASNLRSHCYAIEMQTEFTVKGMAGNIIHAIATTNAIVSGLIVIEAVKLVAQQRDACRAVFLSGVCFLLQSLCVCTNAFWLAWAGCVLHWCKMVRDRVGLHCHSSLQAGPPSLGCTLFRRPSVCILAAVETCGPNVSPRPFA